MSFSQEITKVLRVLLISVGIYIPTFTMLLSCGDKHPERAEEMAIPNIWVENAALELHKVEGRWYYKTSPFSGYAISCHDNGQMATKTGYLDGKREGKRRFLLLSLS